MGGFGLASSDLEQGQAAGSCEHSTEPSSSTKCSEFCD